MKTSMYLPPGTRRPQDLLQKELAQARNIKDKWTRKMVLSGLQKMLHVLGDIDVLHQGLALFTDGQELVVEAYEGRKRIYHCGNQYRRIVPAEFHPTLLVVVDANEATVNYTYSNLKRLRIWLPDSKTGLARE